MPLKRSASRHSSTVRSWMARSGSGSGFSVSAGRAAASCGWVWTHALGKYSSR